MDLSLISFVMYCSGKDGVSCRFVFDVIKIPRLPRISFQWRMV